MLEEGVEMPDGFLRPLGLGLRAAGSPPSTLAAGASSSSRTVTYTFNKTSSLLS